MTARSLLTVRLPQKFRAEGYRQWPANARNELGIYKAVSTLLANQAGNYRRSSVFPMPVKLAHFLQETPL
jgi:hypothetical protein